MITTEIPNSWKQLQEWCAEILNESGFKATSPYDFIGLRNKIELDVFAIGNVSGRNYTVVCECKHWSTRVPQEVVHSFRTVLAETGANVGYIISKSGFQSGAFDAAKNTNIELLTWDQFQLEFFPQWYERFFEPEIYRKFDRLLSYLEPLPAMVHWDDWLADEDINDLKDMYHSNIRLGSFLMRFMPYTKLMRRDQALALPLRTSALDVTDLPKAVIEAGGYRELLAALEEHCLPLLSRFTMYKDRAMTRKTAGEPKRR